VDPAASVSLALIVRDAEHTLGRCLESVRDAVDEVIVVDTGSADATRTVAARYTDRIFDFTWCRDFAAARQFAFDQARGDWVCWLDADDTVSGATAIRPLVADAPPAVAGFYWRYVTARDGFGRVRCACWRERCVRNDGRFRWRGRVHEVLEGGPAARFVRSETVVVEHRPLSPRAHRDGRRNLDILLEEIRDAGARPSPRTLFYLAREHADLGEVDAAVDAFERYLAVSTWDDERYVALTGLAALHRHRRRWAAALDADRRATELRPGWPGAYLGLARTHALTRDWAAVVRCCDVARALPTPDTLLFVQPFDARFTWLLDYTCALYHLGDVRAALDWTRTALLLVPDDPGHQHNMLVFAQALHAGETDDFGAIPARTANHGG
jgi:tetratricopeptide (TPR) repeat protein